MNLIKPLPNIISLIRVSLLLPFLSFLQAGSYQAAFYTFLIAGLSDGIDGKIARTFDCKTVLGSYLDPLSDKLFILSSLIALSYLQLIPLYLTGILIARDLLILIAVLIWRFVFLEKKELRPSLIGKLNMLLQTGFILLVLYQKAFNPLSNRLYDGMLVLLIGTSIISLLQYALPFWRRLKVFFREFSCN
jgi:cardiolipin synthase